MLDTRTLCSLVLAVALAGCQGSPREVTGSTPPRRLDLGKVVLQHTTPAEVEAAYGAADEHGADGSLVYRAVTIQRHPESVTFRFQDGVLSRICRARS